MTGLDHSGALPSAASSPGRPRASSVARRGPLVFSRRRVERAAALSVVTFLLLSTWGTALINIRGYYVPELIAPPLVLYVVNRWPHLARALWRAMVSPVGLLGTVWITFVALLGVLLRASAVGPYSEWRASLLLLFGFVFMYTRTRADAETWSTRLMWVSFGALCLDILMAGLGILRPGFLGQPLPDEVSGRVNIDAINLVAVAYLASVSGRVGLLSLTIALGGFVSLGGHRVVLLATAASALFLPVAAVEVLRSGRRSSRWLRVALVPLLVVGMVAAVRSSAVQDYLSEAKAIQYRLSVRTMNTIDGITRGLMGYEHVHYGDEAIRVAYATYLVTEWPSLLLPHGLGSREVVGRLGPEFNVIAERLGAPVQIASTHDSAVLYLAYHHGWLATWIVGVALLLLLLRRLSRERTLRRRAEVCIAVLGVMLIDLAYPPVPGIKISCIYGMFLGTLLGPAWARSGRAWRRPVQP